MITSKLESKPQISSTIMSLNSITKLFYAGDENILKSRQNLYDLMHTYDIRILPIRIYYERPFKR